MREATTVSERCACRLVGIARSVFRYEAALKPSDSEVQERLAELAAERRRFGYRRLHALLRREGYELNHKRVYRLYSDAGLAVKRRRKRKGVAVEREPLLLPEAPDQVWSMDFVMDALSSGRRLKILTMVDDFSKEALDLVVEHRISGDYVTRVLARVAQFRGYPKAIRTDQGPEFTGKALDKWAYRNGVELKLIEAGKPTQNAYIESDLNR
jgi:putative transposase